MHSDVDEAVEELEPVEYPSEPESATDKLVAKTPWWAISVGLHTCAALIVAFFWVVTARAEEEAVVVSPPRKPRVMPDMKKPENLQPTKKILDHQKSIEDPVVRKVEKSDHNETADEEEFEKAKGESLDFVSDKPFKGKGTYDVMGGGGGGGGRYGGRLGGKKDLVAAGGGTDATEDAVLSALRWLARHQNADGSWNTDKYTSECNKIKEFSGGSICSPHPGHDDYDAGNTGLSLLAFLGAGFSHLSKDTYDGICFGDVVRKGLQWMMSHQDPEGCIGSRNVPKYMYNHTICALAMSEAYGLTGSQLFRDQAQKSVDFTIAAQNPGMGWRYSARSGDNDSSVTGWAVMVLKSAELSGLSFPGSGYEGTRNLYDAYTDKAYGRVGYNAKNTGKVFIPGVNEQFDHHESLTAIGMMARIFIDRRKTNELVSSAELMLRDLPVWDSTKIDFYYWYYTSLALFQLDGPEGPKWSRWNEPMKDALVKNQNVKSTKCKAGSWEPVGRWCPEGGRVYATAINALTLEVYYRYANVFKGGDKK